MSGASPLLEREYQIGSRSIKVSVGRLGDGDHLAALAEWNVGPAMTTSPEEAEAFIDACRRFTKEVSELLPRPVELEIISAVRAQP